MAGRAFALSARKLAVRSALKNEKKKIKPETHRFLKSEPYRATIPNAKIYQVLFIL